MDPADLFEEKPIKEDEQILRLMTERKHGKPTTLWQALDARGWVPRHPSRVLPADFPAALQRFVYDLAWIHVYLHRVDHLSDGDLYEELYERAKECHLAIWADDPESAITLGFAFGADGDRQDVWLRYYACDYSRRMWAKTYPEDYIPPAELPLHRRDWLPIRPD